MYYFIGIKGSGMSSLAVIMKCLGYSVSGSDVEKTFFTEEELKNNNIPYYVYNKNNIKKDYKIILGESIVDDNVELIEARRLNLDIISYHEMVGQLTRKFKTITVAGCHGKTTTSTMLAHIFENTIGCSYLIGDGRGGADKNNKWFILESCEYKRHFLSYLPYYAIILNIDLDHVDYYKDLEDITSAYATYASNAIKSVIAYGDDENIIKMNINKNIIYFGFNENNDIQAKNIEYDIGGTSFDVYAYDKLYGHFDLPLFGRPQLIDALSVITVAYLENIDVNKINELFKTFKGAKRRFRETIVNSSIIIDDYAHHPNEIKAVIEAVKQKYPGKTIVNIFWPHTFSRTKMFASSEAEALNLGDATYVLDIYPSREKKEDYPGVTSELIISKLNNGYSLSKESIDDLLKYKNAVYLFMSPNDISDFEKILKDKLES